MAAKVARSLAAGNLDAYFGSRKSPGPLDVKIGDVVAYTRYFNLQMGEGPTGDGWHRRGKVVALDPCERCHGSAIDPKGSDVDDVCKWCEGKPGARCFVAWDNEAELRRVSTHVLAYPGPNLRFCE